jgi:NAD-reducing hydrogenase small subunit
MERLKLATVWLAGCSGCHMSFLDLDEWLFELAKVADIVFSPIADVKEFPEGVDVTVVEGAVANEENLEMIRKVRARTRILVALGDCAITGNVTSLRNPLGDPKAVLERGYIETADCQPGIPDQRPIVPALLPKVLPVHHVVPVEAYLWGCPPSPEKIRAAIEGLLAGRQVEDPRSGAAPQEAEKGAAV